MPEFSTVLVGRCCIIMVVFFFVGVVGCQSEVEDVDGCIIASASGEIWTMEDMSEFTAFVHPPLGGDEERSALFIDGLTAFGIQEGSFDEYEPRRALDHYRTVLAKLHFERSFEEGSRLAADQFSTARAELNLDSDYCEDRSHR